MVRCYEVGPDRTATIVTVANLLQETAANHAQALWGRGSWTPSLMQEQKLAFALSKMSIRMGSAVQWCVGVQGEPWGTHLLPAFLWRAARRVTPHAQLCV